MQKNRKKVCRRIFGAEIPVFTIRRLRRFVIGAGQSIPSKRYNGRYYPYKGD